MLFQSTGPLVCSAVWVKVVDLSFDDRGPKASPCWRLCFALLCVLAGSCWPGHLPSCPKCSIPLSTAPQPHPPTHTHTTPLLQIGCSIKHVSQSDGTDLDPANTKYRPRGEGGGGPQVGLKGLCSGGMSAGSRCAERSRAAVSGCRRAAGSLLTEVFSPKAQFTPHGNNCACAHPLDLRASSQLARRRAWPTMVPWIGAT